LRELGKNDDALNYFDRLIEFNAINSFVWQNKALALTNLRRNKEADAALQRGNFSGYRENLKTAFHGLESLAFHNPLVFCKVRFVFNSYRQVCDHVFL